MVEEQYLLGENIKKKKKWKINLQLISETPNFSNIRRINANNQNYGVKCVCAITESSLRLLCVHIGIIILIKWVLRSCERLLLLLRFNFVSLSPLFPSQSIRIFLTIAKYSQHIKWPSEIDCEFLNFN